MITGAESFDWGNFINITGPVGAMLVALALGVIVPGKLYEQQRRDLERAYDEARNQGVEVVKALQESNRLQAETIKVLDRMER